MGEVCDCSQGRPNWNVPFTCDFDDWKLESIQNLLDRLSRQHMGPQKPDMACWKLDKKGELIVTHAMRVK